MKAIILAAGEGVRMRPLTETTPKPLLKVSGRPLLEHIVARLPDEVTELVIVIGYLGEQIEEYCGKQFLGKKVHYVRQEKKLGTHHALRLCMPFIARGERFFVLYADDIHGREGLEQCLRYERALLVDRAEDPRKFGVVTLAADGSVAKIVEKPERPDSDLVSTGAMLLDTAIFDYEADVHSNGEYYLTSAIEKMLEDGHKLYAVRSTQWHPIGYPEDLAAVEKLLGTMK